MAVAVAERPAALHDPFSDHEDNDPLKPRGASTSRYPARKMFERFAPLAHMGGWFKGDEESNAHNGSGANKSQDGNPRRHNGHRKVMPGLPRPQTFQRQNSERRERLEPVETNNEERRAVSADRKRAISLRRTLSPPSLEVPRLPGPATAVSDTVICSPSAHTFGVPMEQDISVIEETPTDTIGLHPATDEFSPIRSHPDLDHEADGEGGDEVEENQAWREDLGTKWILNLSMHFRDKSDREKFFISYKQDNGTWRRVTVSCDYRNAPPSSLETTLKGLHYQRDKSEEIYASIRESLPEIKFFDTVTNLKLQTEEDGDDTRLHVHVTEDVNEIVPYPPISTIRHLTSSCPLYKEKDIHFDSHLSGFVYMVDVDGKKLIKKEIPGPDTVEEFLYEVNVLASLRDSRDVIKLEGLVTDDEGTVLKGLLITHAKQGALVDLLYDEEKDKLTWARREKWAKQIVRGLADIHEAGYVQGDFTLSNIVIDETDDAKIIDINRRGCPVGWEPPELAVLIQSGLRIAKYIGTKTDLFQLGMVLWGLAHNEDEPERQERPLMLDECPDEVPAYFRDLITSCLSDAPQGRTSAKELYAHFPAYTTPEGLPEGTTENPPPDACHQSLSTHRSDKEYIDPADAVGLDDIATYHHDVSTRLSNPSLGAPTSTRFDSSGSYILGRVRRTHSPFDRRQASSATSYSSDDDAPRHVAEGAIEGTTEGLEWECVSVGDNGRRVRVRPSQSAGAPSVGPGRSEQPTSIALSSAGEAWAEAGRALFGDEGDGAQQQQQQQQIFEEGGKDVEKWVEELPTRFNPDEEAWKDGRPLEPHLTPTEGEGVSEGLSTM